MKILDKWLHFLSSHPIFGILLVFAVVGIFSVGATNFAIDASAESLLLDDDPDLRTMRELTDEYGSVDFLAITISPENGIITEQTINLMREMQQELSGLEQVSSVSSIDDAILYPDEQLSLAQAFERLEFVNTLPADKVIAALDQLQSNPFFADQLISSNGAVLAVFLTIKGGESSSGLLRERYEILDRQQAGTDTAADSDRYGEINSEIQQINEVNIVGNADNLAKVRQILTKYQSIGEVRLVGPSMILVDMVESLQRDISVFGIAVLFIFIIVLLLLLRNIMWMMIPIACATAVVVIVAGSLGFLDWKVTVLSSNFVALLMILTISLVVHMMVRHSEARNSDIAGLSTDAQPSKETKDAIVLSNAKIAAKEVFLPCLLAAITTGIGFGSLLVSGIKPVEDFGKMMIMGITLAFLFSFILAPAMLGLFAYSKKYLVSSKQVGFTVLTDALFAFVSRSYKLIAVGSIALLAFFGVGLKFLEVDNKFLDYFKHDSEIYKGMYTFDSELGGTIPMEIMLSFADPVQAPDNQADTESDEWSDDSDEWGDDSDEWADESDEWGTSEPEQEQASSLWLTSYGMNKLRKTTAALNEIDGIGKIVSIDTAVELGEGILQRGLSDFELGFLFNALPENVQDILVKPYFSADQQTVRVSLRIKETESNVKRDVMLAEIDATLKELGWGEDEYKITGIGVLYNNLLQSLFTSQILTLGLVLGSIWILLVLMLRSLSLSSVAMVPTLLSSGSVLGILGWTGKPLDIMTVTVAAISVGLAIDNAIHYLNRFNKEIAAGKTGLMAVKIAHSTVAQGIVITNISIMSGFLVFTLSDFIPTIFFGLLVCLAMGIGSLATLTVLPSFLLILNRKK